MSAKKRPAQRRATKKRPNRQRLTRASSFKRIARDLRECSRNYRRNGFPDKADTASDLAAIFEGESKILRAMR